MAYVFVTSQCFGCQRLFSYHPNKVPSINQGGTRYPICQTCVDRVNPMREKNGLPLIVPQPGAYEPADENEIVWND
jgi:Fe-S-cluster-containing dehydrogenase component